MRAPEVAAPATVRVSPDQLRRIARLAENVHGAVSLRQAVDEDFPCEMSDLSRHVKRGTELTVIVETEVGAVWSVTVTEEHQLTRVASDMAGALAGRSSLEVVS